MNISIFYTYVHPSAKDYVQSVLTSTFLSEGKLVKEFEDALGVQLGLINPVAVNSGTSALHLALLLAGVGSGDEVICPAQTFVASALAILYIQATPVFADIQYETGNICPRSIEAKITPKTKAIMAVHWGGYPCDLESIQAIAQKHQLMVIEDAAHALGATYKNQAVGAISDFTCFSFQAIKHLTTGDGGAICCRREDLAQKALASRWFGIDRANSQPSVSGERQYDISEAGYKYHLNNYAAALGLSNLQGFQDRLEQRRQVARRYSAALDKVSGIQLFEYQPDRQSAYWLYGLHVERRDDFILALRDRGVMASVVHQRIDRNSVFGGKRSDLVQQARFDQTQVHIPIHDGLREEDVDQIIEAIKHGW
jgi:perosamine synthetase